MLNLDIFKQFSFLYNQTLCYDCSHSEHVHPFIYAHLILYFWVFNLEIVKSPTVDYIVKFGCNLISFLYIWTLHIDCSHTDMHRRRRSRAEFGLVTTIKGNCHLPCSYWNQGSFATISDGKVWPDWLASFLFNEETSLLNDRWKWVGYCFLAAFCSCCKTH